MIEQLYLTHRLPYQVILIGTRVDLGVMAMKSCPKAPKLKLDHQMQYSVIFRTLHNWILQYRETVVKISRNCTYQ